MGELCSELGCSAPAYAATLCSRHYNRRHTTGDTSDGPRARASLAQRLWRQVDRRGPEECWPWVGRSKVAGYGYIALGGRSAGKDLAHRVAWAVTNGNIPDGPGWHGTVVRHQCDNRLCCNPAHLLLGTQADNVRDMDERGRRRSGNAWASGKRRRKDQSTLVCAPAHI